MDYYNDTSNLERDIIKNLDFNQWDNFRENERDYAYYMQKKKIYNAIADSIKKSDLFCYGDIR